jgi:hypothetical protein
MLRTVQGDDVIYIRHNLVRASILVGSGIVLLAIVGASFFTREERTTTMFVLGGVIGAIGIGLGVLGMLALRERVCFRISPANDLIELMILSGESRTYRAKLSNATRVLVEKSPNASRSATDGWSVRVSGFGEKLVLLARGNEHEMKKFARKLAEDLGAKVEEGSGFPPRPDLPSRHDYT